MWDVVSSELMSLKAAVEVDNSQNRVRFADYQTERIVTLKLTSSDARQLATVKILIEGILRGEVMMATAEAGRKAVPLWHDSFAGSSGVQVVRSFSSERVFVLREENRRQLRVFGKPSDVAVCRAAVDAHLVQCGLLCHRLPVTAGAMNALLKAGRLEALQTHCGARTKPRADFIDMCVEVVGDAVVEQRAVSYLLHMAGEASKTSAAAAAVTTSRSVRCAGAPWRRGITRPWIVAIATASGASDST
jgi:hypothetical protein